MYKLVCIDVDGTLLNDEKNISRRNIDVIKKASNHGVKIAVCTGRMFASAEYYSELLGLKVPVIASNGAFIRGKDFDKVIYKSILPEESCRKILKIVKEQDLVPQFQTSRSIISDTIIYSSAYFMKLNESLPEDKRIIVEKTYDWDETFKNNKDQILKCIVSDSNIVKIKSVKESFKLLDEFEVVSSNIDNFEIMKKGNSKGNGVRMLAEYLNIKKENTVCIGDNENDISMFEYAGLSIAMGNAAEEAKKAADYVTLTNNEDGVAAALEKYILQ